VRGSPVNCSLSANKTAWVARAPEVVFTTTSVDGFAFARYDYPSDVYAIGILGLLTQGIVSESALPQDSKEYCRFILAVFGPLLEDDVKRCRWSVH